MKWQVRIVIVLIPKPTLTGVRVISVKFSSKKKDMVEYFNGVVLSQYETVICKSQIKLISLFAKLGYLRTNISPYECRNDSVPWRLLN